MYCNMCTVLTKQFVIYNNVYYSSFIASTISYISIIVNSI